ncbi:MAG: YARHG domain-containing protein [Armatimonadetes bacterium]|nr:YARHG domain-containing protein [Armatimonadota bacterium]
MKAAFCFCLGVLLASPTWADDRSDVTAVLRKTYPQERVDNVRTADGWALATVEGDDWGGMALLHRFDGAWKIVSSGGGAMGPGELFQVGVPRALWSRLLEYEFQVPEDFGKEPEWTWMTGKKRLEDEDLSGYSAWQLTLMVNEIFAVHGRPFKDPELRAYFASRSWYRPRQNFSDSSLSQLERANAQFIRGYMKRKGLEL